MSTLTLLQIIQDAEIWIIYKSPSEPRHRDQALHHLKRELNFYPCNLVLLPFHPNKVGFFFLLQKNKREGKKKVANWLISSLHGHN